MVQAMDLAMGAIPLAAKTDTLRTASIGSAKSFNNITAHTYMEATGGYHTSDEKPFVLPQLPATCSNMPLAFRLRITTSSLPRSDLTFFNVKQVELALWTGSIVAQARDFSRFGVLTERACTPQSCSGAIEVRLQRNIWHS